LHKDPKLPGRVGSYPSPIPNLDGNTTYVVQAHKFGDYLGRVTLDFDDEDKLVSLFGDPILLDQNIPISSSVQSKVLEWKAEFQEISSQVIGFFSETADRESCEQGECRLANLVLKAALEYSQTIDKNVSISLFNSRGVRSTLHAGQVTVSDVIRVLPFENTIKIAKLSGFVLWALVADAVSMRSNTLGKSLLSRPHFYGLKYTYNVVTEDDRTVLLSISVKNEFGVYEQIDKNRIYKIVTTGFILDGGDNIFSPFFEKEDVTVAGYKWDDVLAWFFRKHGNVVVELEGLSERVQ
jgi:2',3'-cyclic-nucleotide 2'-phosphodiesterase (5'-nucleotidase family)